MLALLEEEEAAVSLFETVTGRLRLYPAFGTLD